MFIFLFFHKSTHCLNSSLGPLETSTLTHNEMVSRRMILSRSRDDLNLNQNYMQQMEDEEDIWYSKEKLFKVSLSFLRKKNRLWMLISIETSSSARALCCWALKKIMMMMNNFFTKRIILTLLNTLSRKCWSLNFIFTVISSHLSLVLVV